ncbi:uncharacterized protein LOC102711627 [Oryza brachyantha]|uniref:uncharacterized protein LOC102711627 n=1 Tax=Oryza brachyantha TaxID=4533 RepID=UPI001ADB86C3|nr:uncharacterized protein LOC102711627 [Oryza brachyantha]
MAASSSSRLFASLHTSSSQITGRPAAAWRDPLGLPAPAVRVRSWRRFAGARCEVSLAPGRRFNVQPRRRNSLRGKASPPPAERQVPKSGSLDAKRLPDLDRETGISGGLDAVRSGIFVSEWNLEGGTDVVRVTETGSGIVGNAEVEGHDGNVEDVMISGARALAGEFDTGECEVSKDSSLSQFLTFETKEPLAVQIDKPQLVGIALSGFATLCAACIVLVVSKLIWGDDKKYLPRNMYEILRPGMNEGELDKGGINVVPKNVKSPADLLGRPQLDRRKLMNNINRAKRSRELCTLSNVFGYCSVANCCDAIITEIRRMVTNVHMLFTEILKESKTRRQNYVLLPHPVSTNGQVVSASHGQFSACLSDMLGSTKLPDISISNNIIEESVESSVDFKNGSHDMDSSVKDQNNVGDIELPKTTPTSHMPIDAKNSKPMIDMAEIEEYSDSPYEYIPDLIPSFEFEGKRKFPDIGMRNADDFFGIKSSSEISSDTEVIDTNDNSHQFSINVVSKVADNLSSGYSNITAFESESKKIPMDINGNDLNNFRDIEPPSTFANDDVQAVQYEQFCHSISMIGKEAHINPATADVLTTKSPQRISEEPLDLMRENVQSIQEPSGSIMDDKHIVHANQINNIVSGSHDEIQASSEADSTGTIDNASTSSVYALPEESIWQSAKKLTKNTSYNEEPEESIIKRKIKMHQEVCKDNDAQTKNNVGGVPEIGTKVDPSNGVCKTERVAKKRLKKMPCDKGVKVPTQDIVQSNSMAGKKSCSQNVKRTRNNLKSAPRNQGAQTRQEISETAPIVNLPDDAPRAENMKPFHGSGSSGEIRSPMYSDTFNEAQPNGFSIGTMRKEKPKHNFQALESVDAAAVKIETNKHADNVRNERAIDFDISNLGVTTPKKMTKRRSLKRRKSTNGLRGATDVPSDV